MAQSFKTTTDISTKSYGYSDRDLTDEITNTIAWLYENSEMLRKSTIAAYLSLLFHLTSLVENVEERRHLNGTLLDFENREQHQIKLHL